MSDHTFVMELTPRGIMSRVQLDGEDISELLRGVIVRTSAGEGTTVELLPARGHRATLVVRLPEAQITIAEESSPDTDTASPAELGVMWYAEESWPPMPRKTPPPPCVPPRPTKEG